MSDPIQTTRVLTEGGIAADHAVLPVQPMLVAPVTSAGAHNTLTSSIVPLACWRANDMRFEFESSFVLPGIAAEIGALKVLIERHTRSDDVRREKVRPGLSVFGHADPTGNDDFNKLLSGRRAQAIYGMLVRRTDLWEDLYSHPLGNDLWEPKAIHLMQATLAKPLKAHPGVNEREALFKEYMDFVCTVRSEDAVAVRDDKGQPIRVELKTADFLASGQDRLGKGDFQGCGEFNPILLPSEADSRTFSDPKNKAARDARNLPNRRVLVLLFRPGARIDPRAWPCPRVKEGVGACKKRFWSDGESRRSLRLPDKARRFEETEDTFACRFYHRLVGASPCERELKSFQVRLYDPFGRTLPEAPFSVSVGGRPFSAVSSASVEGILTLRDVQVPETCVVKWGFRPEKDEQPTLVFSRTLFLVGDDEPKAQAGRKKLSNLGYESDDEAANIAGFQLDFGHLTTPALQVTEELDARTTALLDRIYRQSVGDLRDTDINEPEAS